MFRLFRQRTLVWLAPLALLAATATYFIWRSRAGAAPLDRLGPLAMQSGIARTSIIPYLSQALAKLRLHALAKLNFRTTAVNILFGQPPKRREFTLTDEQFRLLAQVDHLQFVRFRYATIGPPPEEAARYVPARIHNVDLGGSRLTVDQLVSLLSDELEGLSLNNTELVDPATGESGSRRGALPGAVIERLCELPGLVFLDVGKREVEESVVRRLEERGVTVKRNDPPPVDDPKAGSFAW